MRWSRSGGAMSRKHTMKCDGCGKEREQGSLIGHYEHGPPSGWLAVGRLESDDWKSYDFCSIRCLATWVLRVEYGEGVPEEKVVVPTGDTRPLLPEDLTWAPYRRMGARVRASQLGYTGSVATWNGGTVPCVKGDWLVEGEFGYHVVSVAVFAGMYKAVEEKAVYPIIRCPHCGEVICMEWEGSGIGRVKKQAAG